MFDDDDPIFDASIEELNPSVLNYGLDDFVSADEIECLLTWAIKKIYFHGKCYFIAAQ